MDSGGGVWSGVMDGFLGGFSCAVWMDSGWIVGSSLESIQGWILRWILGWYYLDSSKAYEAT